MAWHLNTNDKVDCYLFELEELRDRHDDKIAEECYDCGCEVVLPAWHIGEAIDRAEEVRCTRCDEEHYELTEGFA